MDLSCNFGKSKSSVSLPSGLDTVRALHQTVVTLRSALEKSQNELSRLQDKIKHRSEYREAIQKLSIENQALRKKIISTDSDVGDENDLDICECERRKTPKVKNNNKCFERSISDDKKRLKEQLDICKRCRRKFINDSERLSEVSLQVLNSSCQQCRKKKSEKFDRFRETLGSSVEEIDKCKCGELKSSQIKNVGHVRFNLNDNVENEFCCCDKTKIKSSKLNKTKTSCGKTQPETDKLVIKNKSNDIINENNSNKHNVNLLQNKSKCSDGDNKTQFELRDPLINSDDDTNDINSQYNLERSRCESKRSKLLERKHFNVSNDHLTNESDNDKKKSVLSENNERRDIQKKYITSLNSAVQTSLDLIEYTNKLSDSVKVDLENAQSPRKGNVNLNINEDNKTISNGANNVHFNYDNFQLKNSNGESEDAQNISFKLSGEALSIQVNIKSGKRYINIQNSDDAKLKSADIFMAENKHSDQTCSEQKQEETKKELEKNAIPKIELTEEKNNDQECETKQESCHGDDLEDKKSSTLDIERELENISLISDGDNSVFTDSENPKNESENESEEVDDIELIFTTDETKEIGTLQEDLVSISESEKWSNQDQKKNISNSNTPVLLNYKTTDFDADDVNGDNVDDDVFDEQTEDERSQCNEIRNRRSTSERAISRNLLDTAENFRHQRSTESTESFLSFDNKSLEKDESFDQFEERDKRLHQIWSQCSVLIETDISKCGVVDDVEIPNLLGRRNTCPNPLAYRPIIHRDPNIKAPSRTLSKLRSPRTSTIRPILNESNSKKTESEAQTDISALPPHWKSESYLAHHKVSHNFTTLPSKFTLPISQHPKIRLSEKTQEARRVLLSDINFTSMVPELSRSADHLCQEVGSEVSPGMIGNQKFLRNLDVPNRSSSKFDYSDNLTSPGFGRYYSPSDYSNFGSSRLDGGSSQLAGRYRGSLTSITSPSQYDVSAVRPMSWKHNNCQSSFDSYRGTSFSSRPTFGSVPTSPTRRTAGRSRSAPLVQQRASLEGRRQPASGHWSFGQRNKSRARVTFVDTRYGGSSRAGNHSLPDLRSDSYDSGGCGDGSGGDSTDSLVEEAEHYLRRSIDCMVSGRAPNTEETWGVPQSAAPTRARRASAPDPVRETDPPSGSVPYLPRGARDLRPGHWVKVISACGRVRGGRVRYVGPTPVTPGSTSSPSSSVNDADNAIVGVELATPTGNSDGSFSGRRYFDCEPEHAIFVPFKKVIMAWST